MNRKIIAISVILLIVVGAVGWRYYDAFFSQSEGEQKIEKKISEEEIKKREEFLKEALIKEGVQAIIHTKVLRIEKNKITVQELYPYRDNTGKTYPVRTFVLTTLSDTKYGRRTYLINPDGQVTTEFKDEGGSFEEMRIGMFVSAMVLDVPSESKKIRARTIVYFDRFPGVKYEMEEEIKVSTQ